MAYTSNGVPYVQPTDAVSDYPNTSLELANYIDGRTSSFAGPYTWSPGNLVVGTHNLTGHAFNGEVGDVWTGSFNIGIHDQGGSGGVGWVVIRLRLASGILLANPAQSGITFETQTSDAVDYVSWSWRATQANDYLIVDVLENPYGTLDSHIQATAINHGGI